VCSNGPPLIDADFPGGNILIDHIEGDHVYLRQDCRDTPGFWFYWHLRVRQAAGRTLTFHFTDGKVSAARGPAVSTDGGSTWDWLGPGDAFSYAFPADGREVRFCLAMPYLEANLQQFLDRHAANGHLRIEPHAVTRKGRTAERLHLGNLTGMPRHRVLLTCRHHACEMMASWAVEGIMETILSDSDDGRWLRRHVEFAVVPFMDKDGVEDGDQGKNRSPHDHNRDYLGQSIYPTVAAMRQFAPAWSNGRLQLALDLHCPNLAGDADIPGSDERIFFVENPSDKGRQNLARFSQILHRVQTGPLVFDPRHNLPWGQSWNKARQPRSFARWADLLPGMLLAAVLEIPYANAAGQSVTVDSSRHLGHDLAATIRQFLTAVTS